MSAETVTPPVTDHLRAQSLAQARQSSDAAGVEVVEIHDAGRCQAIVDLLNRIWGSGEMDILDVGVLVALAHAGNYVAVATRDGIEVGAGIGFFGPPATPFHSHIVGVEPGSVGRGIGRSIKLHQRAWCLERGVTQMTWTYDPLVARNGYFNIRRLGALPTQYHRDFYGEMSDAINSGQFSDRMLVHWDLVSPATHGFGGTVGTDPGRQVGESPYLALGSVGDGPDGYAPPPDGHGGAVLVAVPPDIERLRHDDPVAAAAWRATTREAFTDLLGSGWAVQDFLKTGHYLLRSERTS